MASAVTHLIHWAANGALKATGGAALQPVLGDVKTGVGALVRVFGDLHARHVTLADGVELLNSVQSILVDMGLEPRIVQEAILAAETILPIVADFYRAAGVDPFVPMPRPGPPVTEADWSHGPPQPVAVDNPSGAIGGDNPKK